MNSCPDFSKKAKVRANHEDAEDKNLALENIFTAGFKKHEKTSCNLHRFALQTSSATVVSIKQNNLKNQKLLFSLIF